MNRGAKASMPSLKTIQKASPQDLRRYFEAIFKFTPSSRASVDFLRGNIAWTNQLLAARKDPIATRKSLINTAKKSIQQPKAQYRPGTRLIRTWQGQTYEVTVLEKGFLWRRKHFKSLSKIAQEITGTKWSGPRFFGLTKTKS